MPRKPSKSRQTAVAERPARRKAVARKGLARKVAAKDAKCVVCGDPVAPFSMEELCWVCRRLKISAWRESDNLPAMQE
jgi:hypothetical protein